MLVRISDRHTICDACSLGPNFTNGRIISPAPADPSAAARAWRLLVGPAIRKMEHPAVTSSASTYSVALYLPHRQAVSAQSSLGAVHHTLHERAAVLSMRAEPALDPDARCGRFACAELHARDAAAHAPFSQLWRRQP